MGGGGGGVTSLKKKSVINDSSFKRCIYFEWNVVISKRFLYLELQLNKSLKVFLAAIDLNNKID